MRFNPAYQIYQIIERSPLLTTIVGGVVVGLILGLINKFSKKNKKEKISDYKIEKEDAINKREYEEYFKKELEERLKHQDKKLKDYDKDLEKSYNGCLEDYVEYLNQYLKEYEYSKIKFKIHYRLEDNQVKIHIMNPICKSCNCDLFISQQYDENSKDNIELIELECPKCKQDKFSFNRKEYMHLQEKLYVCLNYEIKNRESSYRKTSEEYYKWLDEAINF